MSSGHEAFVPSRLLSSLDESPFARLFVAKPVNRYDYVVEACRGERVLDLGAYDETEVHRQGTSFYRWLHADIAAVAHEVLGVDASETLRLAGEIETTQGLGSGSSGLRREKLTGVSLARGTPVRHPGPAARNPAPEACVTLPRDGARPLASQVGADSVGWTP